MSLIKLSYQDTFTRFTNKNMHTSTYSNKDRKYIAKKMRKGYDIGGVGSAIGVGGLTYALSRKPGLSIGLGAASLFPGAAVGSGLMLTKHLNKINKEKK